MKQVIDGKIYNTETATEICRVRCHYYPGDFNYHKTFLYRTPKMRYFLAGEGGPMTMWAERSGNGLSGGCGIRTIDPAEAQEIAEQAGVDPDSMVSAGFTIEEG